MIAGAQGGWQLLAVALQADRAASYADHRILDLEWTRRYPAAAAQSNMGISLSRPFDIDRFKLGELCFIAVSGKAAATAVFPMVSLWPRIFVTCGVSQ